MESLIMIKEIWNEISRMSKMKSRINKVIFALFDSRFHFEIIRKNSFLMYKMRYCVILNNIQNLTVADENQYMNL